MDMTIWWGVIIAAIAIAIILFLAKAKIFGKAVPDGLKRGQPLPDFSLIDEHGNRVNSADLAGTPAVLLFVRGSWCPFCSKQVADLTKYYKEITASGARLILITPKPLDTTRRVADFFEVEFEFWLDESLKVSRRLGLINLAGVPKDYREEYGEDTMWPASLVIDRDGIIRLSEVSKFIVDRPNPQKLFDAVGKL